MLGHDRIPEKEALKRLLDELQVIDSRAAAFQTFCNVIADIGFNGAMFISRATGPDWVEDIAETTYPKAWVEHYVEAGYTRTDPTRRFATRQAKPFLWSEMFPQIRKKEMRIFHEAREFGLMAGIAVPIFASGTLIGGLGISAASEEIEISRLKATMGIAAQIFCTVYNQIFAEEKGEAPSALERLPDFTKRELEVLTILAAGLSNQQIADTLHISHSAAVYHIKNVFEKLGVENRVSAVVKGLRLGLISPE